MVGGDLTQNKEPRTEPDITSLVDLFRGPVDVRSLSLTGLFVLASLYTMFVARPFLLPVVTAILLNFLLAPAVALLVRYRVPRPFAAATLLFSLLGLVGFGLYATLEPANEWLQETPRNLSKIEAKISRAFRPVEQVGETAARVEKIATGKTDEEPRLTVSDDESLGESIFAGTQSLIASAVIVLALLFFLLSTEDLFLRKLVRVLPRLEDKKRAVEIARQIQSQVSVHLLMITLVNLALGGVMAVAMYLLGMPSPILWGVMATAFNFVPYLGAIAGTVVVGGVALLTFEQISQALVVPAVYATLTGIEGSVITPAVLGRKFKLNPVVIFLGVFFWGWLWGVPGSLLAVPMLLVLKVFCDNVPPLNAIGEFLGR